VKNWQKFGQKGSKYSRIPCPTEKMELAAKTNLINKPRWAPAPIFAGK